MEKEDRVYSRLYFNRLAGYENTELSSIEMELQAENADLNARIERSELALKFAVKKLEDITGICPIDCLKSDFKGCLNDDCKNQMKECWEKWCLEQAEKALKEKK